MAVVAYVDRGRLLFDSGSISVGASETPVGSIALPHGGFRRAILDVLNLGANPLTDFLVWVRGHPSAAVQYLLSGTDWLAPSATLPFVSTGGLASLAGGARGQAWLMLGAVTEIGFAVKSASGTWVQVLCALDAG